MHRSAALWPQSPSGRGSRSNPDLIIAPSIRLAPQLRLWRLQGLLHHPSHIRRPEGLIQAGDPHLFQNFSGITTQRIPCQNDHAPMRSSGESTGAPSCVWKGGRGVAPWHLGSHQYRHALIGRLATIHLHRSWGSIRAAAAHRKHHETQRARRRVFSTRLARIKCTR